MSGKAVVDIVCGSCFNYARLRNGALYSWGIGENGELGRKVCEMQETIEARDGTVNRNRLEVFLARETDEQWRIVQETILPAAGQSFGGGTLNSLSPC